MSRLLAIRRAALPLAAPITLALAGAALFGLAAPAIGDSNAVAAFSADGRRLAAYGSSGTLRVWELPAGRLIATVASRVGAARGRAPTYYFHTLAFSPDGRRLAVAPVGGLPKVWDTAPWRERWTLGQAGKPGALNPKSVVSALSFSSDGSLLALGTTDRAAPARAPAVIRIWDARTGRLRTTLQEVAPSARSRRWEPVQETAFSPDGRSVLSLSCQPPEWSSVYAVLRFWNLRTRKVVSSWRAEGWLTGLSQAGTLLATTAPSYPVRLWDMASGRLVRELPGERGHAEQVALSADARLLAVASPDLKSGANIRSTVRLLQCDTGRLRASIRLGHAAVAALGFSSDGRLLAVRERRSNARESVSLVCRRQSAGPGITRLYRTDTGAPVRVTRSTRWAGFPPEIAYPLSATGGTLRVHDPATGKVRLTLPL